MRCWVTTVVQPVFDKVKIIADTPAVDSHPVESFNPLTIETVFFEGRAAEVQALGCLPFADEEKHDDNA